MIDEQTAVGVGGAARTRKVLVIDDNQDIVELIRHALLLRGGYEIVTAYNGADGLEKFYHEHPDCVVVDVKMPELDGFQFVRAIRGDPSSANTALVILSALHGVNETTTGRFSGVDAYLAKPFAPNALYTTLDQVMMITPEERAQRMERLADGGEPEGVN